MSDGYNGWTNKPTWRANLWLMNDEGCYRECVDLAHYAHKAAFDAEEREDRLATLLEEYAEELLGGPRGQDGWLGDILGEELGRIDWPEIARVLADAECEDYPPEDEDEEGGE